MLTNLSKGFDGDSKFSKSRKQSSLDNNDDLVSNSSSEFDTNNPNKPKNNNKNSRTGMMGMG
jgi:hypothetical protein